MKGIKSMNKNNVTIDEIESNIKKLSIAMKNNEELKDFIKQLGTYRLINLFETAIIEINRCMNYIIIGKDELQVYLNRHVSILNSMIKEICKYMNFNVEDMSEINDDYINWRTFWEEYCNKMPDEKLEYIFTSIIEQSNDDWKEYAVVYQKKEDNEVENLG